jgi:hypothetical protein
MLPPLSFFKGNELVKQNGTVYYQHSNHGAIEDDRAALC